MAGCDASLGIANGKIRDDQLVGSSAYENQMAVYGAHRARLNRTSWPQGFRTNPADVSNTWVKVDLEKEMIVTGVATQGYGDPAVEEWVEAYYITYQKKDVSIPFMNLKGGTVRKQCYEIQ